ncbi:macrolide family glycosyltransferase [Chitinophaga sancti]|uniref:macrolide family glycosyltransferase n=1 Tax=Chitinophaga sancti TaxID=1004 RepID=UPI002A74CAA8|nr:macrolide family glycosyltransferase [Chitinophaga sancti]WPQ60589.1 macrolide family glycosyltransferase [Chitinophaga sancti]
MSKVLFLSVPSHGHVNPTIGLVTELIKNGNEVIYFATEPFRQKIEATGAMYQRYLVDLDLFKPEVEGEEDPMLQIMREATNIIDDILLKTSNIHFDYIIHSTPFPFTEVFKQLLKIPAISSLGIFLGLNDFLEHAEAFPTPPEYAVMREEIKTKYNVNLPGKFVATLINLGGLNLVYSSRYFVPEDQLSGDTYRFVGPPVFDRKEQTDFPFKLLKDRKVIYISLGTVFSNFNHDLYQIFFDAFAGKDVMVVMAAYNVDLSRFKIPDNFIVRHYIPQLAILQHTDVAITHAGMNSISDLLYNNVPFVAIPLGADQPDLAGRTAALGATISLDHTTLTPAILQDAVEKVLRDPSYAVNMQKISDSFKAAGGYPKAVAYINEYIYSVHNSIHQ